MCYCCHFDGGVGVFDAKQINEDAVMIHGQRNMQVEINGVAVGG
jgi:hypothetical protein